MIQNLTSALQKKVDKSNWQTYRFDELVHNIVEKVSPRESGLEKYIGLEHLDSGSLKIKRFGSTQAIKGDKLKIYKGDLIFAKRNSYLKRVAIVDEDAVASAHSLVLRAKVEHINPSFLPFFLLSETFWSRAIQISVGSLSPTINWKVLARQEFLLPPKDQQAELAELLWAMDNLIESHHDTLTRLKKLNQVKRNLFFIEGNGATLTKSFSSYTIPNDWRIKKIEAVANVEYGISKSVANNKDPELGWQILTGANIKLDGSFDLDKKRYIEVPKNDRFFLNKGDLMFNWRSGSPEHIGKTAYFNLEGDYTYASFILRIRCGDELRSRFGFFLLNFLREIEYFTKNISKQINFKINASICREIEIPIPNLDEQDRILSILEKIFGQEIELLEHIEDSKKLQKSIINQIF